MAEARSKTRIGEANIERILDAGLAVFSRYGLRGARTDQIAVPPPPRGRPSASMVTSSAAPIQNTAPPRTFGLRFEAHF